MALPVIANELFTTYRMLAHVSLAEAKDLEPHGVNHDVARPTAAQASSSRASPAWCRLTVV
jgi:hypothetical protein